MTDRMMLPAGVVLGALIFTLTSLTSKKSRKYYRAPLITFFLAVAILGFSAMMAGRIKETAYPFVTAGILLAGFGGTLAFPFLTQRRHRQIYKKRNLAAFVVIPVILLLVSLVFMLSDIVWPPHF